MSEQVLSDEQYNEQIQYPTPVYNESEFGEELVLLFPDTNEGRQLGPLNDATVLSMVPEGGVNYGGVDLLHPGTNAATSTFTGTFQLLNDMPAFIFKVMALLMYRLTVGVGNTVDISMQLQIQAELGRTGVFTDIVPAQARAATGVTADEDGKCYFDFPAGIMIPKHRRIRFLITLTSTRTAGANNTQIQMMYNRADRMRCLLTCTCMLPKTMLQRYLRIGGRTRWSSG